MAKRQTRYQRLGCLIQDQKCGLIPLDYSCACPKRGGPEQPHPDHPGKVGWGTCRECQHNTGTFFHQLICTHPRANEVASQWLAEQIKAWEERHAAVPLQPTLF